MHNQCCFLRLNIRVLQISQNSHSSQLVRSTAIAGIGVRILLRAADSQLNGGKQRQFIIQNCTSRSEKLLKRRKASDSMCESDFRMPSFRSALYMTSLSSEYFGSVVAHNFFAEYISSPSTTPSSF